jgi:hypothetical protein
MILKLLSFLLKYPTTSPPTVDSIFGEDDPTCIASNVAKKNDENVRLAATNDVVFYSMLSILKLQPYANPVNFNEINYLKIFCQLLLYVVSESFNQ